MLVLSRSRTVTTIQVICSTRRAVCKLSIQVAEVADSRGPRRAAVWPRAHGGRRPQTPGRPISGSHIAGASAVSTDLEVGTHLRRPRAVAPQIGPQGRASCTAVQLARAASWQASRPVGATREAGESSRQCIHEGISIAANAVFASVAVFALTGFLYELLIDGPRREALRQRALDRSVEEE